MTTTTAPGLSNCPAWCCGDHERALDEGCELEDIQHYAGDNGIRLDTITNPYVPSQVLRDCPATIRTELLQDAMPAPFGSYPLIELEISAGRHDESHRRINVHLTTGEARTLAAMLTHYADLEDLHHHAKPNLWERVR